MVVHRRPLVNSAPIAVAVLAASNHLPCQDTPSFADVVNTRLRQRVGSKLALVTGQVQVLVWQLHV